MALGYLPVQSRPGPGQKLHAAIVDARGHAIAVELDLVHPLRPRGRLLDRLGKLRRDEARKGRVAARRPGLEGLRGRTLDDTRHGSNYPMELTSTTRLRRGRLRGENKVSPKRSLFSPNEQRRHGTSMCRGDALNSSRCRRGIPPCASGALRRKTASAQNVRMN